MPRIVGTTVARNGFTELIRAADEHGEPVYVTHFNVPRAVIVGYQAWEQLQEQMEAKMGNEQQNKVGFAMWAVVHLFGYSRIVGWVTEQDIAGQGFLRVDVPATTASDAHTEFYGPKAIYKIAPISEEVARAMADYLGERPISVWEMKTAMSESEEAMWEDLEDTDDAFETTGDTDDEFDEDDLPF